jgi:hypothetical protein
VAIKAAALSSAKQVKGLNAVFRSMASSAGPAQSPAVQDIAALARAAAPASWRRLKRRSKNP